LWKTLAVAKKAFISKIVNSVFTHLKINNIENCELGIVLTSDKFIHQLNNQYRKKDKPTNVLSFPYIKYSNKSKFQCELLGEIFISYETLEREAKEQGKSFKNHFTHLIVHSVLHILGYDHMKEREAQKMEALEVEILAELGISDPYK